MKINYPACLRHVLAHEGGYVDHPRDPGGATNMGITLATLRDWRHTPVTRADVRNLTRAEAGDIYAARYWRPIRGDDLPAGVDLAVFDYAVNSGPGRASMEVQRIVGAAVDGRIGPATLAAIEAMDRSRLVRALCARRLSFLRALRIWDTFGRGWSRRVAEVEAAALGMVLSPAGLRAEAGAARSAAAGQAGAAVATGAGGAATGVPDMGSWPVWLILLAVTAVAVPLVIRAVINLQRARALAAAARE